MRFVFYLLVFLLPSFGYSQYFNDNLIIQAPASTTPGSANTFIGVQAGNLNTTGSVNTFVGNYAGQAITSGYSNSFLGYMAGYYTTTGHQNVFLGVNAGGLNLTGFANVLVGWNSGRTNNTGAFNTILGNGAAAYKANGISNVIIGNGACIGQPNPLTALGNENIVIGDSAGYRQTGINGSVFLGSKSGFNNQIGKQNTYLGYQSGYNTLADSNTFVGYRSGYTTTTGKGNTFFGTSSGRGNSTGNNNTFVGNGAGPANSNSDDNVYIGFNTGNHDSGSRNTLLGTGADAIAQNVTNATAIGAGATVAISDAVILGNQASVGIGTSAPTARLEVNSGTDNESGIRLSRLTANSPVQLTTTDKLLTVDATGKLILTSAGHYSVRSVNDWSDKVFMAGYKLRSLPEVDQYIQKHQHLPGVPSAAEVVEQGIDAAKMDAKLLEKIEELTLYSIQLEKANQKQADKLQALELKHQQDLQAMKQKQAELEQLLQQVLKRK